MQVTLEMAAEELGVPVSTIQRWLRQGVIPFVGGQNEPLFEMEALRSWAIQVRLGSGSRTANVESKDNLIQAALRRGGIQKVEGVENLDEALQKGTRAIGETSMSHPEIVALLLERERIGSTAMGGGVGLPHPQNPSQLHLRDPIVRVIYLDKPLDLHARDRILVHTLFVLLATDATTHLKLLSATAKKLMKPEFITRIARHPELEELIEQFEGAV